jgi:heterodisulfide reductase subunit C
MVSIRQRLDEASDDYEEHLRNCRQCGTGAMPCAVAKYLRRVHNNLLRSARQQQDASHR